MPDLTIGFARADITPPLGTPMIGYFYNGKTPRTAQSVHDPLYASAMVVRSGGTGAALVGVDTLSIKRRTATAAREAVARALGILIENIMVSASHTHSGPAVCTALGYKADERAISVLHDGIVTAAREAAAQARPLRLGVACGAEH
ncbi:MAG: hypothetical protein FJ279_25935, partial [Planctomycetes bacterium]|nr:hypothetical protein [Planctomycetota bacterium]